MKNGRMRFSGGPGELVVLGLLNKTPMHGYQIHQTLCEPEKKPVYILCMGEGTLYPLLYRLERRGLVKGQWIKAGEKRKQRQYRLTQKGKNEYERLLVCWTRLARAVHGICGAKQSLDPDHNRLAGSVC